MGSFPITLRELRDELGDLVGVRTGLAWCESHLDPVIREFCPELVVGSVSGTMMRATDFEDIAYSVLHKSGDPCTSMGPKPRIPLLRQIGFERYVAAADRLHHEVHRQELHSKSYAHHKAGDDCKLITLDTSAELSMYSAIGITDMFVLEGRLTDLDEDALLGRVLIEHGRRARNDCAAMLRAYRYEQRLNPWSRTLRTTAPNLLALSSLFEQSEAPTPTGTFIDQRFIDYLNANLDRVSTIHWRQFERLVAEYMRRQGYSVELGPGVNDDNIDIRVWSAEPQPGQPPLMIIQCKRWREKIGKIIVKALWADVQETAAMRGLVATTSALSDGATSTIRARGYGIDVADHRAIREWLTAMRTPEAGVTVLGD